MTAIDRAELLRIAHERCAPNQPWGAMLNVADALADWVRGALVIDVTDDCTEGLTPGECQSQFPDDGIGCSHGEC